MFECRLLPVPWIFSDEIVFELKMGPRMDR